ncbi:MAG: protoporphyrinogen oxidase [Planctomycetes bacterium]|nr:protoporphyrinogen oxidase [Planctomycetota bacterium]
MAKRLVVVGSGISGLAAAHEARVAAREGGIDLEIVVLEKERVVGGKARTYRSDEGFLVETGPTGFLDREPVLNTLTEAAGLEKMPANQAAARRFLVRGDRVREIHAHPLKFVRAGILGPLGMLRVLREPWVGRYRSAEDESVWEFAKRRLGRQLADRMIAPMVLGVFAGDAKKIQLDAAFPRLRELENEHGSLIRGMLARKKQGRLKGGPAGPGAVLTSYADGLQTLPTRLAERGDFTVRTGAAVAGIARREDGGFRVALEDASEAVEADAVVLACEAFALPALVRDLLPDVARELEAIPCPPVAVVALGYRGPDADRIPKGFGVLIPRSEPYRILGCLWDSHIFAGRAPDGSVLVRAMLGGSVDTAIGDWDEERLLAETVKDVTRMFSLQGQPTFHHVKLWKRAIPQYEKGHLARRERVEHAFANVPGLVLAGNALHGVAFGQAAARGELAGREAVALVGTR